MSSDVEIDSEHRFESHYISGSKVPGYQGYCPITKIWGCIQPDGTLLDEDMEGGKTSYLSSDFILNPGFLILYLGHSVEREHTVEKAAQALHSSLTSLFAACDVPVDLERIRTTIELSEFMKSSRCRYSNIIIIGHGSTEGIRFLDKPNPIKGAELAGMLGYDASNNPLQILSLCCHSGCKNISSALSSAPGITEVIAPSSTFDMRWAVHFVVGYFLSMYVNGMTIDDAIQTHCSASRMAVCIWRQGQVVTCNPASPTEGG